MKAFGCIAVFVALLPLCSANAASPAYVAYPCVGCDAGQYEQAAIGKGLGPQYLYDFSRKNFAKYDVIREPNGNGTYRYEANVQSVEAEAMAVFNKAEYVYRTGGGTLTRSVVLNLPQAPNAGNHSDASVFDLARTSGGAKQFGDWLAQYFTGQNIPVSPSGTQELDELRRTTPAVTFTGDKKRIHVRVNFKDGTAEFEITEDEQSYNYKEGTAFDDQKNKIPFSTSEAEGRIYDFDNKDSDAARGFDSLFEHWNGAIGHGGWRCGVAAGGDGKSITCVFVR